MCIRESPAWLHVPSQFYGDRERSRVSVIFIVRRVRLESRCLESLARGAEFVVVFRGCFVTKIKRLEGVIENIMDLT